MPGDVLAIITARGGSKRIPGKNVRDFNGQPIIKYSIDAAVASGVFSEVMVSTDDDRIAALAERLGASIPFRRSPETSDDTATTAAVLLEVLEEYEKRKRRFSHFCCIYPTAPFVTAEKIRRAWRLLREDADSDAVISVSPFTFPIWRSFKIEQRRLVYNWPEHALSRSQDLPPAYHDCGQIYFLRTAAFLRERRVLVARSTPMIVPPTEVQDIDTEEDWVLAELKYARMSRAPAGD